MNIVDIRGYKCHNFYNRVIDIMEINPEESITPYKTLRASPLPSSKNVTDHITAMPWINEFFSNGTSETEVIFGPSKRHEFREFMDKPLTDHILDPSKGVRSTPRLMSDFRRMITYNKLTDSYGLYNLPDDATWGNVVYNKTDITFTTKENWQVPPQDKLDEMIEAGLISSDYYVNDPFRRATMVYPTIRKWSPFDTIRHGRLLCSTFAYRKSIDKSLGTYNDWHNVAWIKRPGEELMVKRRNNGRNFIIPLNEMTFSTSSKQMITVPAGRPVQLNSEFAYVNPENVGFIIHVHQINTQ